MFQRLAAKTIRLSLRVTTVECLNPCQPERFKFCARLIKSLLEVPCIDGVSQDRHPADRTNETDRLRSGRERPRNIGRRAVGQVTAKRISNASNIAFLQQDLRDMRPANGG